MITCPFLFFPYLMLLWRTNVGQVNKQPVRLELSFINQNIFADFYTTILRIFQVPLPHRDITPAQVPLAALTKAGGHAWGQLQCC